MTEKDKWIKREQCTDIVQLRLGMFLAKHNKHVNSVETAHLSVNITAIRKKTTLVQKLTLTFRQPLPRNSDRAKAITTAIGVLIAADLRPYSVVENTGFKHML